MYILFAILSLTLLGLSLGYLLGASSRLLKVEGDPLADQIEALLPGSQCGQCGYPGCRPAAEALACGEATITLCPPGGRALAEQLAAKLDRELGSGGGGEAEPLLAQVDETNCIGCTRCFKACPTDAIVGAPKQIHAVVTDACIGCGKCVDICPTECLQLHPVKLTLRNWRWPKPQLSAA